jgi:hypothetical protein
MYPNLYLIEQINRENQMARVQQAARTRLVQQLRLALRRPAPAPTAPLQPAEARG